MACCFKGCDHPDDELFPIYFNTLDDRSAIFQKLECHAACIERLIPPTARPISFRCAICGGSLWRGLFYNIDIIIESPGYNPEIEYHVHRGCLQRLLTLPALHEYDAGPPPFGYEYERWNSTEWMPSTACCFKGCNHPDDELFPIYFSLKYYGPYYQMRCHASCIEALIPPTARPKFLKCAFCGKSLWSEESAQIGIYILSPAHNPKIKYEVHRACLWGYLTVPAIAAYNKGSPLQPEIFPIFEEKRFKMVDIEKLRKAWRS